MEEPVEATPREAVTPVRTGVARVDRVLEAVEQLEDRPLEEHVGAFEVAHDELRRALDADPDAPVPDAPARTAPAGPPPGDRA
ncbi:hypothetical protein [Nocardioides sp. SYSU DS0663]|uniref:hypothetical protein n=1 Tax=Nocardioides sp. SYSU DS0663 TaxID=3416445 RepID=UPI003F4C9DA5